MSPMPGDVASPLEIARCTISAYVLGDTQGFMTWIHPETRLVFPGDPTRIPWAGTYLGQESRKFHQIAKDTIDILEFFAYRYEVSENCVFVFMKETARVKATGRLFHQELIGVFTFEQGRWISYLEYGDTAQMEQAFFSFQHPEHWSVSHVSLD